MAKSLIFEYNFRQSLGVALITMYSVSFTMIRFGLTIIYHYYAIYVTQNLSTMHLYYTHHFVSKVTNIPCNFKLGVQLLKKKTALYLTENGKNARQLAVRE